ncbi:hypothetical protein GCM10010297_58250 [Streptomyces malachitofuscus]|nr:hypothetical protein GCM10010297_58250 [Streptomyces malachitofuscus]
MGIWINAFTAPDKPELLPRGAFGRLVVDLVRDGIVHTPWALLVGDLCVNTSLLGDGVIAQARWERPPVGSVLRGSKGPQDFRDPLPPPWGGSDERAHLLARDEDILQVLPALEAAPYGEQDVAVVFDCLDFSHPAIDDHFQFDDHRTPLVCFSLVHPRNRPLNESTLGDPGGPMHPVRTCIVHTFKLCVEEGPPPPIASLATRYFGPDLVHGATWG